MVKTEGRKSPFMLIDDIKDLDPAASEDLDQPMNLLFRVFTVSISQNQLHQQDHKTLSNRKVSLLDCCWAFPCLNLIEPIVPLMSLLKH